MDVRLDALLAILGMGLATYLTRIAGLLLVSRITVTPRLEGFLQAVPGAILVSLVAPGVLGAGLAEGLAGLVTGLVAWRTRTLLPALAAGVVAVVVLRRLL